MVTVGRPVAKSKPARTGWPARRLLPPPFPPAITSPAAPPALAPTADATTDAVTTGNDDDVAAGAPARPAAPDAPELPPATATNGAEVDRAALAAAAAAVVPPKGDGAGTAGNLPCRMDDVLWCVVDGRDAEKPGAAEPAARNREKAANEIGNVL